MNNCKHCQRGIPLQHGIHLSELEMVKCELYIKWAEMENNQ